MASFRKTKSGYFLGEVVLAGMKVDNKFQNDIGRVFVGGDRGDVEASYAENHGKIKDCVILTDVEFKTTLGLDNENWNSILGEVNTVVQASYESIGNETFIPQKRKGE